MRCPLRQLQLAPDPLERELIAWRDVHFPLYQKGHLLVAGGIAAQPARWLEAMRYLEGLASRSDAKYIELTKPDAGGA